MTIDVVDEPFVTQIEPFRIKMVETIRMTTRAERASFLAEAGYNLFKVPSELVLIDLLTDSGTGAMSCAQWAALMRGDESYAGSPSFYRFEAAVRRVMGFEHVIPTHQGRAAERILFHELCAPGDVVPNNTHFDTTRANLEELGAVPIDLPCVESSDLTSVQPFKGNMDVAALRAAFREHGAARIPLVMMTVTNNAGGGQPASLANLREVAAVCEEHDTPLYLDACRFAENAFLIKQREPGCGSMSVREIVTEMFALADGCTMSAKKDGMANIGGFVATRDHEVAQRQREWLTLVEGFPTYGGLAGRDLEAVAVGLEEALDEDYLAYRVRTVAYLAEHLSAHGVPVLQPPGGHAVFIDAAAFAPHLSPLDLPGISVANGLYVVGGVRVVEIGTAMFGRRDEDTGEEVAATRELVRLALPRRMYTQSHVDYVVEAVVKLHRQRASLPAYRFRSQTRFLRHFTATYAPADGPTG